jgi:hypothetical protein
VAQRDETPVSLLDPNKIAAEVILGTGEAIIAGGASVTKALWKSLVGLFSDAFDESIKLNFSRVSSVKTILNPEEPCKLLDIYTQTRLKCGDKDFTDIDVIEAIDDRRHLVITGTGGLGKSMFMKYLAYTSYINSRGTLPLFVELRNINRIQSKAIVPFIYYANNRQGSKLTLDDFERALEGGLFTLILDGFDEIDPNDRAFLEGEILNCALRYPKTKIIVSSRPDDRFRSWETFHVFRVQGMSKDQVLDLISKVPFDKDVKKKFSEETNKTLFQTHGSFFEIPLLVSMMLLTYRNFASVPSKLHLFYEQAFQTLFLRHDAQKMQFSRRRYTSLDIDEFRRCFSAFCRLTYMKGIYSFDSDEEIEGFLKTAIELAGVRENPKNLIKDASECVCLIQKDGTTWTFAHRSFQEYFCAIYVGKYSGHRFPDTMDKLSQRDADSVVHMIVDMYPDLSERDWIHPKLLMLKSYCKPNFSFSDAFRMLLDQEVEVSLYVVPIVPDTSVLLSLLLNKLLPFMVIVKLYETVISDAGLTNNGGPFLFYKPRAMRQFLKQNHLNEDERFASLIEGLKKENLSKVTKSRKLRHFGTFALNEHDFNWLSKSEIAKFHVSLLAAVSFLEKFVGQRVQKREAVLSKYE